MTDVALRVRTHFPDVHITLMSIVMALGLENLISELRGLRGSGGLLDSALVWSQAFAVFAAIVTIWTGNSLGALTLRWSPRIWDLAGPLLILVLVNLAIAAIGAETCHLFLYVTAAASFLAVLWIRTVYATAEKSGENQELLARWQSARDTRAHATLGILSLLAAALVHAGLLPIGGALIATLLFGVGEAGCALLAFRGWERAWGIRS